MGRVELGDSIELIKTVKSESVHLILSDIPYGINLMNGMLSIGIQIAHFLGRVLLRKKVLYSRAEENRLMVGLRQIRIYLENIMTGV
ncbi:MAG: hypothetical protein L6V90_02940 [Treponema succinifaciens]|nr:MAG: hypothetical protein L6V90_02940 [Treponema succinifaciens]